MSDEMLDQEWTPETIHALKSWAEERGVKSDIWLQNFNGTNETRVIHVGAKYDSRIYVIDSIKKIFKLDCGCSDFIHRRLKRIGEFADIRYYAEPCKHLQPFVDRLVKMGYVLKKPDEMIGDDKLTNELRKKLMIRANYTCECGCGRTDNLQVHRKTRGSNGGKYNMLNCQVLAKICHDLRHENEFPSKRSK